MTNLRKKQEKKTTGEEKSLDTNRNFRMLGRFTVDRVSLGQHHLKSWML
jgi:hypothetical protein